MSRATTGLPSYIIKEDYFYVYYGDSKDLGPGNTIQNTTVGGAGNPDQGVAVVRAPVADVIAAAKQGKVVGWQKYYQGAFTQPAMGNGKFTPLSLPPQGYMHGDAAFIKPLKMWVMVQQSGGRIRETDTWRKNIILSFSADGLFWSHWQTVYSVQAEKDDGVQVTYPSLMSLDGLNNEVLGETFAVVFQYRGGNATNPPFQYNYVNVTVKKAGEHDGGRVHISGGSGVGGGGRNVATATPHNTRPVQAV